MTDMPPQRGYAAATSTILSLQPEGPRRPWKQLATRTKPHQPPLLACLGLVGAPAGRYRPLLSSTAELALSLQWAPG